MSAENDIAIKVEHVTKDFKLPHDKQTSIKGALISFFRNGRQGFEKQHALKDVSFEIKKGEFFGIVGRNGSGKSTLLKMLAGIYTPTKGNITVNGKLTPFIELGVGFNHDLSGRENVFLNGALLGFNRKEMEDMYDDIVEFAELERFMDQKLKNYSSGMQVRLAFSIAIRAQSDMLLLDEVLAVGDAAFQQKCFDYFEELKRQQKTVVFVSHDMGAVQRFCNRAVYIKNGDLLHDGTPTEVADMYTLDNMESMKANEEKQKKDTGPELPKDFSIVTKIDRQTDKELVLDVTYKSKTTKDDPMYVAFSLIRDGASIAELTTPLELKLTGDGRVTYTLDLTLLNSGSYEIPTILCLQANRKLVALAKRKNRFVIKGNDPIRGASMWLADTWKQAK
ncbi:MAG TPA: ABC transporter ATP-binding protein [Candidatus Saccharimonadales bacterium]|nr:ABC transporter ATP-binding protein [Candidatus Saccharimonadales bacterium]